LSILILLGTGSGRCFGLIAIGCFNSLVKIRALTGFIGKKSGRFIKKILFGFLFCASYIARRFCLIVFSHDSLRTD